MPLSEQEKIKLAKAAFDKFIKRIAELLEEQKLLFERVMEKVEAKKINECRGKICEVYKKGRW